MNNPYPPNMDMTKVNPVNTDDRCYECEEGIMVNMYFWLNGKQGAKTGDLECEDCGAIEVNSAVT